MFMDDSGERISELGLAESSARLFPAFSIMLTSRATIGAIAINTHEACTNQGFITCLPNEHVPIYLLYHWLTENVPKFQRMASGATFKEISRGVFKTIEFLQPPPALVRHFENAVRPMAEQGLALQRQVENLRRTRDLLLPRLLSGGINVFDSDSPDSNGSDERSSVKQDESKEGSSNRSTPSSSYESAPKTSEHQSESEYEQPPPIDQTDRSDVLAVIRQVFSDGQPRNRPDAIREVARALGYGRVGHRLNEVLQTDLLTAVRRGILDNVEDELILLARSIAGYDRDLLKQQFLAAVGRSWIERDQAVQNFCRWMGFRRTGPIIDETARSLIQGLLRESRLEADGHLIRRSP